jgi:hypothetical protein
MGAAPKVLPFLLLYSLPIFVSSSCAQSAINLEMQNQTARNNMFLLE